jgi:hypothetical protein
MILNQRSTTESLRGADSGKLKKSVTLETRLVKLLV